MHDLVTWPAGSVACSSPAMRDASSVAHARNTRILRVRVRLGACASGGCLCCVCMGENGGWGGKGRDGGDSLAPISPNLHHHHHPLPRIRGTQRALLCVGKRDGTGGALWGQGERETEGERERAVGGQVDRAAFAVGWRDRDTDGENGGDLGCCTTI